MRLSLHDAFIIMLLRLYYQAAHFKQKDNTNAFNGRWIFSAPTDRRSCAAIEISAIETAHFMRESAMKKLYIPLCLSLFFFVCQSPQPMPELLHGRVLILGDSITQDGRYVSVVEYELFKNYPGEDFDIISIGLSSETVSGLTEPNHPYPRPNLHERLGRALEKIKPQTVFACYGMNDGIYYPQSEERFQAYKDGIQKLIADVQTIGAKLVILTPPIFDADVPKDKVVDLGAPEFGYAHPYKGYNDVLADYADWLLHLNVAGVQVIDLNGPMLAYTQKQRQTNPDFAFSKDGVHPQLAGHILMAQLLLNGIGAQCDNGDPQALATQFEQDSLFQLVQKRRNMRSMAWLLDVGFQKPGDYKGLPVAEAEAKAAEMREKIVNVVMNKSETQ